MTRVRTILLTAGLAGFACAAYAADAGSTALLPADAAAAFKLGASAADYAKLTPTTVTGQPFKNALRIEVTKKPQRSGDVTLSAPVDAAMANGDVLLVTFYMRSGTKTEATLDAGFRAVGSGAGRGGPGGPPPAGAGRGPGAPGAPAAAGAPPAASCRAARSIRSGGRRGSAILCRDRFPLLAAGKDNERSSPVCATSPPYTVPTMRAIAVESRSQFSVSSAS